MTQIMRPDYSIKDKPKKIIMLNSQPTKIIRDKIEKTNLNKKKDQKVKIYIDLKIKITKFDTNKIKSNHEMKLKNNFNQESDKKKYK